MKKILFPVLALALVVGCSKNDAGNSTNDGPVEIKIAGSVVSPKSIVNPGVAFTANYIVSATAQTYGSVAIGADVAATTGAITFNPLQYYPQDNTPVYLIGYAPVAAVTDGVVSYTLTGDEDIMVTQELSGTKTTQIADKFLFDHLLSQIQFKIGAEAGFTGAGDITSVTVKDVKTDATLTLNGATPALTFDATVANLPTVGITSAAIPAGASVGAGCLLIGSGLTTITCDIVTTLASYSNITVTFANATLPGNAYEVTFTISRTGITPSADVAAWITNQDQQPVVPIQ